MTLKKITANFNGAKVLVAEDYFVNQELTKEILELMGCVVDVASDGMEALSKYKESQYDLILMDIQMPIMDGYEATKAIREIEQSSDGRIPIIAVTANALNGDREACIAAGMDDYISKPIKGESVEDTLKKFINEI
ncbi:response regulator [Rickettsiales bacterium]|nr:response regulator [Rickettsiales bacterium]